MRDVKQDRIHLTQLQISPFCDKVRRVLHIKKLDYSTREVRVTQLASLRKSAPTGKVPILQIGDRRLWDSTDICLELERLHPTPSLVPDDPLMQADTLLLEDWADETLYFYEVTMRFVWAEDRVHWSRQLAAYDQPLVRKLMAPILIPRLTGKIADLQGTGRKSRDHIVRDLHRLFGSLETRIASGGYCVGSQLTLADISIAAQLHCIQGSGLGAQLVAEHDTLNDWKQRIDAMTLETEH